MNSSMLAGERRWATARRGGMTVLGKVAVPKPINLPSQRLENHGLDPNVEIVPKGTVSWGSRSSSSGSNPWSSSLSPNADGGTVSPSHLSGRPSSGSGTRPSTAGSDRTHDAVPNAWASNSRPSSASGTLSSTQAPSASLRPRSAENRPNSSQLSRFAEPVAKSPTAWSSSATAERLGVKSSKDDGFSLSSGDFPTLGTEKDNSVKNESEDQSRPSSASGRINQPIEDTGPPADVKHGTVDTWRADGSQSAEDDIHPSMERWQGDPHQHFNPNAAPHHFDAWRGPPMNGPGGWYGGRPQGPAFGAHVPPGGFPMEPFPYYHRPQIPPPPLAGPQPVPPPGPRGPHPKNGDMYRPQMPEAYPRPGMPFRPGGPGFYPRPPGPMAFDGYYGPPVGYERDMPYMGMPGGPPVYNGYPPSNPDISNPHGRASGRGPPGKTMSEEVDHWDDARGPKRAPLRSHNECDQREGGNREQNMQHNVSHPGKRHFPVSSRKNEWGAEEDTEEDIFAKRTIQGDNTFHSYENRVHSADGVKVKSIEGMGNVKGGNDNWTNRSSSVTSFPPVVTPLPVAIERDPLPAVSRNSSLMNKIDGLNAKFRGSDGWNDSPSAYNNEEERNRSKVVDMKNGGNSAEVGNIAGSFERTPVSRDFISGHHEVVVPVGDNVIQPAAVVSRRSYHGGHNRVDQRGRGRFNSQEADGWRRKPLNTESSSTITASNSESLLNARVGGPNVVGEASESSIIEPEGKIESDSAETYESTDIQRAKMRELAKQRALQLQKEEEERIKEQKAKALAKLEELNRRTLAGEVVNQKPERTQQELHIVTGPMIAELNSEEPGFNLVPSPAVATIERESNPNQARETVKESISLHLDIKGTATLESNASPQSTNEDSHDSSAKKGASQVTDGSISRNKRTSGYKQRHNNLLQKSSNENSVSSEAPKDHPHVSTTEITLKEIPSSDSRPSESNVLNTSNTVVEPSAQQRRKINRAHKTKPKPDETLAASAVPTLPPVSSDTNQGNEAIGNGGSNDSNNVSTVVEPDSGVQAQVACSSVPNEESQSRVPNQWKPHHSRKLPRSQQAHRFNEKLHGSGDTVVWAPVRSQNKAKGSDEASQNSTQESANSAKADNVGPNSLKGKRAEMERYVPKPVAKELAQQGSVPPLSSSVRSNEGAGGGQCGSSVEINEGDGNHIKNKKDHGAWRHGGSTDSSRMKGVHTGTSSTSEPIKEIHQSSEINTGNADTKSSVKDQGATGRGRRHPQRGPRSTGKNPDPESSEIDGSSIQPALDVNQTDRNNASKENRSFGERAPHWQPKGNRPNSANNLHGSRTTGSESVNTEINRIPKKDHPQLEPGESVNVKNNMAEESTTSRRRDVGQENKPVPYKGRPYSPNLDIVDSGENTGDHHERNVSSGYRRGGRQNNRPARGHDSRGDWSSGHDNRPNNRERQRQNVQYEYQPVGPVKGNRPEKAEEPAADGGGDNSMDHRHRERGYGHMKRGGNSYKRQSGAAAHVASVLE